MAAMLMFSEMCARGLNAANTQMIIDAISRYIGEIRHKQTAEYQNRWRMIDNAANGQKFPKVCSLLSYGDFRRRHVWVWCFDGCARVILFGQSWCHCYEASLPALMRKLAL